MIGGDFPAWLADLLGRGLTVDLTDTRASAFTAPVGIIAVALSSAPSAAHGAPRSSSPITPS
jgi:hypothetical protein